LLRDEDVLTVRYALLVIAEPERKAQPLAVRRCLVELLGAWAADGSGDVAIGAGEDDGGSAARKKHMQGLVTWLQTAACQRVLKTFITDNGILKTCEAYFTSEHEALDFQVDVVKDIMSSRVHEVETRKVVGPLGFQILERVVVKLDRAAYVKVKDLASYENKGRVLSDAATYIRKAKALHQEGFSWSYEMMPEAEQHVVSRAEQHLYKEIIKTENMFNQRLDTNHGIRESFYKQQSLRRKKDLKSASKQQPQQDGAALDHDAGALQERMAASDAIGEELVREEEEEKKRANKKRSKAEKKKDKGPLAAAASDPASSAAPSRPTSPTLQDEPKAEEGASSCVPLPQKASADAVGEELVRKEENDEARQEKQVTPSLASATPALHALVLRLSTIGDDYLYDKYEHVCVLGVVSACVAAGSNCRWNVL
jgi:hypothetical protein